MKQHNRLRRLCGWYWLPLAAVLLCPNILAVNLNSDSDSDSESETEPEQAMTVEEEPYFVVIGWNSTTGRVSIKPITMSVTDPRMQINKQATTILASVRNGTAQLPSTIDGFLGAASLEITYPHVYNALTYRCRQHQNAKTVNYASELSLYAITTQWLQACENWLSGEVGDQKTAIFPETGKSVKEPKQVDSTHPHHELWDFLRYHFMSLSVQVFSLVSNPDQLDDLLVYLKENNWREMLYNISDVSESFTFCKAMRQFSAKNGIILQEILQWMPQDVSAKNRPLKNFFISFPVTTVICGQAMNDKTQDELSQYNTTYARLDDSDLTASANRDLIDKINTTYPNLTDALQIFFGEKLKQEPEACTRAAKQLLYLLAHLPTIPASFHGYPVELTEAKPTIEKILEHFEQAADSTRGKQKLQENIARAVCTVCEWIPFSPLFADIIERQQTKGLNQQPMLVPNWLSQIPSTDSTAFDNDELTYRELEQHGVLFYAALRGITGSYRLPWWEFSDACFKEDHMKNIIPVLNPEHAASYFTKSIYRKHFSTVKTKNDFHTALKKVCHERYPQLKNTHWQAIEAQ